jgi:DNA primase catalytic core
MIPTAELVRVKRDVDLVALMQAHGVALKRRGRSWQGRCPFHEDGATPSLSVSPDKGLWRCFGCGASGDAIRFVELCDRVGFPEAVHRLGGAAVKEKRHEPPALPEVTDAERAELLGHVCAHYRARLLEGPEGAEYLRGRGIADATLRAVAVGYCDGTLVAKVRPTTAQRAALLALGVLTERGREALAGCVVFPLTEGERVVGLYGRRIDASDGLRHLFLRGPRRGLWNAERLRQGEELFLTEGIIDALTLLDRGETRVLPLYGTNGLTAAHRELLRELQPRRVWLCLDADEAGQKAAVEIAAELARTGLPTTVVELDCGKDLSEYFTTGAKTLADFRALCARALGEEPAPPAPGAEPGVIVIERDGRRYRLRPLTEGAGYERLRVHVRAEGAEGFHIDIVDLYSARARQALAGALAEVFACPQEVVRKELLELVEPVETEVARRLAEKTTPATPRLTPEERELGLRFLRDPALFNCLAQDYEALGLLGEEATKLVVYLCATSRQLDDPLAVVIQSRSAAGKSALAEATVALLPDEARVHLTRLTPQALFYLGEDALRHKLLCIEEEAGTQGASYSLRTMQSQKELTIASTGKDPQTGKLRTDTYRVAGPVALLLTTTEPRLEEETQSRFVVLAVDESAAQTQRILQEQRRAETLDGLTARLRREAIIARHHAAQRLLRENLQVVNPLAPTLLWPEGRLRARRDQKKLLVLLRAVAYLRQWQKEVQHLVAGGREVAYVEVDEADVAIVRRLAPVVLGPTLDELSVPARRLLGELQRVNQPRFSRREARELIGWSDYQTKTHLRELVELEYVAVVYGGGKGARFQYELLPGAEPPPVPDPLGGRR